MLNFLKRDPQYFSQLLDHIKLKRICRILGLQKKVEMSLKFTPMQDLKEAINTSENQGKLRVYVTNEVNLLI